MLFQSTPSVWRETAIAETEKRWYIFQSTPSVWRETFAYLLIQKITQKFQSTPSVWRETAKAREAAKKAGEISIHSLRVEGDKNKIPEYPTRWEFQSTPSVWRETTREAAGRHATGISIHSLRVEGDIQLSQQS